MKEIAGADSDFLQSEELDMLGEIPGYDVSRQIDFPPARIPIAAILVLSFSMFIYYSCKIMKLVSKFHGNIIFFYVDWYSYTVPTCKSSGCYIIKGLSCQKPDK